MAGLVPANHVAPPKDVVPGMTAVRNSYQVN
jgi:hypothetical protein